MQRRGFTLVEAVVLIFVLGILVALLLPADLRATVLGELACPAYMFLITRDGGDPAGQFSEYQGEIDPGILVARESRERARMVGPASPRTSELRDAEEPFSAAAYGGGLPAQVLGPNSLRDRHARSSASPAERKMAIHAAGELTAAARGGYHA